MDCTTVRSKRLLISTYIWEMAELLQELNENKIDNRYQLVQTI